MKITKRALKMSTVFATVFALTLLLGIHGNGHKGPVDPVPSTETGGQAATSGGSFNSQAFVCPIAGCEVATDATAMMVLVMHQTDTPGDNGAFNSSARTEA